jgi:hypothetical protein
MEGNRDREKDRLIEGQFRENNETDGKERQSKGRDRDKEEKETTTLENVKK